MLAVFCLRLACGLIGMLLLLSPAQINPRFYRTHFLTALGLSIVAAVFQRDSPDLWLWPGLASAILCTLVGSIVWSLEHAPGGRLVLYLATLSLVASLAGLHALDPAWEGYWALANELSSAAVLGAATTAMLMGHSYLIAPSMSLTPLLRLLGALFVCVLARGVVAAAGLWFFWTAGNPLVKLNEVTLLLPLRWTLGILLPLILGFMAWQTARIRSTQSATGILYVVVIFCFLGELVSQLLCRWTGLFL
jgi:hypothetical protein